MTWREFLRFHLLKVLLGLVVIQLGVFAWLQYRNIRPMAVDDETTVFERHAVIINPLRNDFDKDEDDDIQISTVDSALYGKISINGESIQYHAKQGFFGTDSFQYTITDGDKISKPAFIKVKILENSAPKITKDYVQIYQGNELSLNMLSNDIDIEEDSIFIDEILDPVNGEITVENGVFKYKHTHLSALSDSFSYTITDGYRSSDKGWVIIDIITKNSACYPWLSTDVGLPEIKGNLKCTNGMLQIEASGNDIWNNQDDFFFAYQPVKGNFEISAEITALENTHPYAKALLMIRESLDAGSPNAVIGISSEKGLIAQVREAMNSSSFSRGSDPEISAPYWFKLVRNGNKIIAFSSPNGKNWKNIYEFELNIPKNAYIGLAVTSHTNEKITTAKFKNIKLNN